MNRRMDSAKLWLNNAEDETAIRNTSDSNISNDAKLPEPVLPSPEPQQQQIQQNNDDVGSAATKDSNNNNGVANNDSNQSLVSPPHPRPNVDIILSLKDPVYCSVMTKFFQLMGKKSHYNYTEEAGVKDMANEALLTFKNKNRNTIGETDEEGHAPMTATATTTTTTVRFFKPKSRNVLDGKFVEVDEQVALRSEFTTCPIIAC